MENAEIIRPENPPPFDRTAAPLFDGIIVPPISDPAAAAPPITENPTSPISDQSRSPPVAQEPLEISASSSRLLSPPPLTLAVENSEPEQGENSQPSRDENRDENRAASGAENSVAPPPRKLRRKPPVKKVRSQKRTVVPLKFFVSPAEKESLKTTVKGSNCSLSNYIRVSLGLPPNEAGRKKQNVAAAFDLSDTEMEVELELD